MYDIIFATANEGKLAEAREIMTPFGFNVLGTKNFNVEETGKTFSENAIIKAKTLLQLSPEACVFADDSGLCVDALDGKPGVMSNRFFGDVSDKEKCKKLLELMKDISEEKRGAKFVCSVAFYSKQVNFGLTAECEGKIGYEIIGEKGFGYDPIFMYKGKSFAELTQAEKNTCSHRAGALTQLCVILSKIIKENLFTNADISEILNNLNNK
jgi:XTP/dITP diphosphohydrolase